MYIIRNVVIANFFNNDPAYRVMVKNCLRLTRRIHNALLIHIIFFFFFL